MTEALKNSLINAFKSQQSREVDDGSSPTHTVYGKLSKTNSMSSLNSKYKRGSGSSTDGSWSDYQSQRMSSRSSLTPNETNMTIDVQDGYTSSTSSLPGMESLTPTLSGDGIEFKPFEFHGRIARLVKDTKGIKSIDLYVTSLRNTRISDYWNFWCSINDLRKLEHDNIYILGKSLLIYQKYIKKDAYRYIECFNDDQRNKLYLEINSCIQSQCNDLNGGNDGDTANNYDNNNNGNHGNHVNRRIFEISTFNELIMIIEDILSDELFNNYFISNFYKDYIISKRLD